MYVVVRSYSEQGASALFDVLGQREEDVKALIGGVPGFVSYTAFRSGGGGMTVTVCEDKAGTDESSRRAAEWVKENISTRLIRLPSQREAPSCIFENLHHPDLRAPGGRDWLGLGESEHPRSAC
jgi:hypothetical protein